MPEAADWQAWDRLVSDERFNPVEGPADPRTGVALPDRLRRRPLRRDRHLPRRLRPRRPLPPAALRPGFAQLQGIDVLVLD